MRIRDVLAVHDPDLFTAIVVLGEGDFEEGRKRILARTAMISFTVEFKSVDPGVDP